MTVGGVATPHASHRSCCIRQRRNTPVASAIAPSVSGGPARDATPPPAVRRWRARVLTSWNLRRFLVILTLTIGVSVLLYPSAANWWHDRTHRAGLDAYARSVASQPPEQIAREWRSAHRYNSSLPPGQLVDPYAVKDSSGTLTPGERKYRRILDIGPRG